MASKRICAVTDCVNASKAEGICKTHLDRKTAGWTDWDTRPLQKKRKLQSEWTWSDYERWEYYLLRDYNLEKGSYERILAAQGGRCAICKTEACSTGRRFAIDHDHRCCPRIGKSCGKCVRGLLCGHCNHGLGKFNDSPERLLVAAEYLKQHPLNEEVAVNA